VQETVHVIEVPAARGIVVVEQRALRQYDGRHDAWIKVAVVGAVDDTDVGEEEGGMHQARGWTRGDVARQEGMGAGKEGRGGAAG
jgi:hypothetical protein